MTAEPEFDVDYIDIILAVGQPPVVVYDVCHWCDHAWHGMACTSNQVCNCDTSAGSRDDSWRPRLGSMKGDKMSLIMHETGCDGWTADAAVAPYAIIGMTASNAGRIKRSLYGKNL
jgi:hypothetical protein